MMRVALRCGRPVQTRLMRSTVAWSGGNQEGTEGGTWSGAEGVQGWLAKLDDRALIHLHGADALTFLQRLTSNDMCEMTPGQETPGVQMKTQTRSEGGEMRPAFTTFLSQQGRLLYDALVIPSHTVHSDPIKGVMNLPSYLLDVDAAAVDGLTDHLRRYRLRSEVVIDNVTEDYSIFALGGPAEPEVMGTCKMKSFGVDGMKVMVDPRSHALGLRAVSPTEMPTPKFDPSFEPVAASRYRHIRHTYGVAQGVGELPPGKLTPLECNVVELKGISFTKGCYLGQELQARTYHTGVIRKRILPLQFHGNSAGLCAGVDIVTGDEWAKKVGTILGVQGNVGLGMLRLKEVLGEGAAASLATVPQDGAPAVGVTVHPYLDLA